MDTFDMPTIQIMTTSLHDITHHDIRSPHRHSPVSFMFDPVYRHDKKIKVYKENKGIKNEEKLLEFLLISSQSWS